MDIQQLHDAPFYHWLLSHQDWLGISIAVIAFVESFAIVGIIVPGVALLSIAAFVAGTGVLGLPAALAAALAGAVTGDGLSYLLGRYGHRHIYRLWPLKHHRHWIDRGEQFFRRYGLVSVAAGRFVGPIRPVMPLVAGSLLMTPTSFFTINIVSALGWAPMYILPGYLAGASVDHAGQMGHYLSIAAGIVIAVTIALAWLRYRYLCSDDSDGGGTPV